MLADATDDGFEPYVEPGLLVVPVLYILGLASHFLHVFGNVVDCHHQVARLGSPNKKRSKSKQSNQKRNLDQTDQYLGRNELPRN